MELLKACPICKKPERRTHLTVEDCLVSHESFALSECIPCGFVYTSPRPPEEEIGKYYQSNEYVSHNDTGKGIIHFLYQKVKSITLRQKYRLLKSLHTNASISLLDYGCGTGSFAAYVGGKGHAVSGLEPDAGARSIAAGKIETVYKSLAEIPSSESFSVISLWHVLEHVHLLDSTVSQLVGRLGEGGIMVIALPNRSSHDAKALGKWWAAYDVPRHLYHFSKKDICALLKQHGMISIGEKPMWFDAFYVGMLSYRNKGASFPVLRGFWMGLISNLRTFLTGECSSMIYIFKKP
ncbi:MAG: class I SAM-dependent methyltransferase [Bacteroidota bacterium]